MKDRIQYRELSPFITIDYASVVVDIPRLSPLIDSFLQRSMHLATAESDLFSLLDDEVSQDCHCLPILAIYGELATA